MDQTGSPALHVDSSPSEPLGKCREVVGTKNSLRQAEPRTQKVDTHKIWL